MKKVYVILAIAALVLCTSCGNNKKKSCDCNCEECKECTCEECKDTCTCKNAEEAVKEAAEAVQEAAEKAAE